MDPLTAEKVPSEQGEQIPSSELAFPGGQLSHVAARLSNSGLQLLVFAPPKLVEVLSQADDTWQNVEL